MPDSFWMMVSVVAPVVVLQISAQVTNYLNNKKANATRDELKTSLSEVKDHLETVKMQAVRSQEAVENARKAGERAGFVGGIEEGKKQSTGPTPL